MVDIRVKNFAPNLISELSLVGNWQGEKKKEKERLRRKYKVFTFNIQIKRYPSLIQKQIPLVKKIKLPFNKFFRYVSEVLGLHVHNLRVPLCFT